MLRPSSLAAAFKSVVDAFVSGIILPPISLLPFIGRNLDEKFAVLHGGGPDGLTNDYNTSEQALEDGATIMKYGLFLNQVLNFIGIAVSLFVIARLYGRATNDNVIKKQVRCKYCRKYISEKAVMKHLSLALGGQRSLIPTETMHQLHELAGRERGLSVL